jgi:hypothetical protein
MDNADTPKVVNIARAFLEPKFRPSTAAVINAYLSRREAEGLSLRLNAHDIERLGEQLHWHAPPPALELPDFRAQRPDPVEPGHPDDPERHQGEDDEPSMPDGGDWPFVNLAGRRAANPE